MPNAKYKLARTSQHEEPKMRSRFSASGHFPALSAGAGVVAGLMLLCSTTIAAVPVTIGSQGTLRGPDGAPVANGVYKLTFALYDGKDAKTAAWTEGPIPIEVKAGVFAHALGSLKPLDPAVVGKLAAGYLGVKVDADPELPRQPLRSVAYAMTAAAAEKLACSGCVTGAELSAAAVASVHVGFNYAGSKIKGGAALVAHDLLCTGCVSVAEMKFDGDVDLQAFGLKAGKITADQVIAKTVSASSFIGDGSKLTGVQTVTGTCATKGEVVKGVKADGSLVCVAAMDPNNLPADGLNEISNDLLSNQFVDEKATLKAVPILDNNPKGSASVIDFPNVGIAQKLWISAEITNSDLTTLQVELTDPSGKNYVLKKKGTGKKGDGIKTSWPDPTAVDTGDLGVWIGKNPQGKWTLTAIDTAFLDNKTDGEIKTWSVKIQTLSTQKVAANGRLVARNGIRFANKKLACDASSAGTVSWDGVHLQVCDGSKQYPIIVGAPGGIDNPGKSCKHIRDELAGAKSGTYWIDPDGNGGVSAFKVECEMEQKGGGWTRVTDFAETTYENLAITERNSLRYTEVLLLEYDYATTPAKLTNFVTQQTCYSSEKQGFQTTGAGASHCDTGLQIRIGGPGGSCGGEENGCFGIYKGKLAKAWGCNWDCSAGAVTVWGKGYNCNGCRCRNAPHTTTAGCGSGGGKGAWGKLRFRMYVR